MANGGENMRSDVAQRALVRTVSENKNAGIHSYNDGVRLMEFFGNLEGCGCDHGGREWRHEAEGGNDGRRAPFLLERPAGTRNGRIRKCLKIERKRGW